MRIVIFATPAVPLLVGLALVTPKVDATPAIMKETKKSCVTCHVSAKSKELNDAGKYYKENKKLPAEKK